MATNHQAGSCNKSPNGYSRRLTGLQRQAVGAAEVKGNASPKPYSREPSGMIVFNDDGVLFLWLMAWNMIMAANKPELSDGAKNN